MRTPVWQPGVDRIAALARQPTDLVSLWQNATRVIANFVPHYMTPCWYTVDPASLLITSHVQEGLPEFPAEWLAGEYYNEDVNQINDVLRSTSGLSTLHEAAGGDPSATKRWQRNMMMGGDQELLIRLRSKSGVWGVLGLYREPDRPLFSESEKSFLQAVAPHLADGARRALLIGEATDPEDLDAPGLLIITERWEVESATTPGLHAGCQNYPMETGTPGISQPPCSPLPGKHYEPVTGATALARSRSHECCLEAACGWCCMEQVSPLAPPGVSP
jgi:hypothetical protein